MPIKAKLPPEQLNRFGQWAEFHRKQRGITVYALCEHLGLLYDKYQRMIRRNFVSIHLPTVIKMAQIFDVSPLEPLLILYNMQESGALLTETEKQMYVRLLVVFDRFLRLDDRSQEFALSFLNGMLEKDGERPMASVQAEFVEKLRMAPAGEAGNAKIDKRLKNVSSSDYVAISDEHIVEQGS